MVAADLPLNFIRGDSATCRHACGDAQPTAMWVYRLGPKRAKRMLFTGDKITGTEAEQLGLVLKAVPPAALDAEVEALAECVATVPINQLMMQKLVVIRRSRRWASRRRS
jgi:enoyl-CoA hydratase/carnithine racemase